MHARRLDLSLRDILLVMRAAIGTAGGVGLSPKFLQQTCAHGPHGRMPMFIGRVAARWSSRPR
ncbi:hypothetical protein A9977_10280 [Variovorax sp. UMC13]|nr:hypothetical protein [Variovorax sp. UMC13]